MKRIDSLNEFLLWAIEYQPILQDAIDIYGPITETSFWMHREYIRMNNGEYKVLPYHTYFNQYDFLHIAQDGARASYIPTYKHGLSDRQLVTGPGKYFSRRLGETKQAEIKACVAWWNTIGIGAKAKFGIGTGVDMFREVYINNDIHSCMNGDRWQNRNDTPVAEFFGHNSDFGIAYERHPTNPNRYIARAIVNIPDKKYARIFDATDNLNVWLHSQGYKQTCYALSGLCGNPDAEWLPYIDGCCTTVCRSCGCIQEEDDSCSGCGSEDLYAATSQLGDWIPLHRHYCEDCDDRVSEDDLVYIEHYDRHVCQGCLDSSYVYAIINDHGDTEYRREDDVYNTSDGYTYLCEYAVDHGHISDYIYIESESTYYHIDEVIRDALNEDYYIVEADAIDITIDGNVEKTCKESLDDAYKDIFQDAWGEYHFVSDGDLTRAILATDDPHEAELPIIECAKWMMKNYDYKGHVPPQPIHLTYCNTWRCSVPGYRHFASHTASVLRMRTDSKPVDPFAARIYLEEYCMEIIEKWSHHIPTDSESELEAAA